MASETGAAPHIAWVSANSITIQLIVKQITFHSLRCAIPVTFILFIDATSGVIRLLCDSKSTRMLAAQHSCILG